MEYVVTMKDPPTFWDERVNMNIGFAPKKPQLSEGLHEQVVEHETTKREKVAIGLHAEFDYRILQMSEAKAHCMSRQVRCPRPRHTA